jgi:hypothetical protein
LSWSWCDVVIGVVELAGQPDMDAAVSLSTSLRVNAPDVDDP